MTKRCTDIVILAHYEKLSGVIMKISHPLIRGLIKALSPNKTIFNTLATEICSFIVNSDTATLKELSEAILNFLDWIISGI